MNYKSTVFMECDRNADRNKGSIALQEVYMLMRLKDREISIPHHQHPPFPSFPSFLSYRVSLMAATSISFGSHPTPASPSRSAAL